MFQTAHQNDEFNALSLYCSKLNPACLCFDSNPAKLYKVIWWRHYARPERKFYCRIPWGSPRVVVSHGQSECYCTSELFCLVLYHYWNSELCCKYEKCWFGQLESLFHFDGESVLHWMEAIWVLESQNLQCWPHRIVSMKITWSFTLICF